MPAINEHRKPVLAPSAAKAILSWYRPTLHSLKWGTRQITRALETPSRAIWANGILE